MHDYRLGPVLGSAAGTDEEGVRDVIGAALVEGSAIDITVNDGADTITIAVDLASAAFVEGVQDALSAFFVDGIIDFTYDDASNQLTATIRSASTSQTGVVQLATTAEATAGTDTSKVLTPGANAPRSSGSVLYLWANYR